PAHPKKNHRINATATFFCFLSISDCTIDNCSDDSSSFIPTFINPVDIYKTPFLSYTKILSTNQKQYKLFSYFVLDSILFIPFNDRIYFLEYTFVLKPALKRLLLNMFPMQFATWVRFIYSIIYFNNVKTGSYSSNLLVRQITYC